MRAYYNENDPKAAAWLRELIKEGLIAPGEVDERSITEVLPNDLINYAQCHFFAGIGGWSLALRLAGVPDDEPIWTGSCPCQPFSAAGQQRGESDDRHLWPVFRELMRARRPAITFGEQVASKLGREWLAGVFADLEGMGYQRAGADLCAASVGAPHIRQRLFWMANASSAGAWRYARAALGAEAGGTSEGHSDGSKCSDIAFARGATCGLAFAGPQSAGRELQRPIEGAGTDGERASDQPGRSGGTLRLEHATGDGREQRRAGADGRGIAGGCGVGGMGDTSREGLSEQRGERGASREKGFAFPGQTIERAGSSSYAWSRFDILPCLDRKARRVESGTFPLAHGIPGRVGLLRGYGNAIVPQVAAAFIEAALGAIAQ